MARRAGLLVAVAAVAAAGAWTWLLRARAPVPQLAPRNGGAAAYDWRADSIRSAARRAGEVEPSTEVTPFKIEVSDAVLTDLRDRIKGARPLPTPLADRLGWEDGMNVYVLASALEHWATDYDWRAQEARLNAWPQFTTVVDGLKTHFVHLKADRATADIVYPLLLVHGWPGSFVEFLYVAGPLTTGAAVEPGGPRIAFDLIIPSIPGYAFSDAPTTSGMGPVEIAEHFAKLMDRLGYQRYFYQGGDWGSIIGKALAQLHGDRVIGLHINMFPSNFPSQHPLVALVRYTIGAVNPAWVLADPAERAKAFPIGRFIGRFVRESGYMHEQATRPTTLGVALNDSPAGLAAWILEKFYKWSEASDGRLSTLFSIDDLLTNLMVYWVTGSITSSVRLYREALGTVEGSPMEASSQGGVAVPVGLLCSPVNALGFECMPRAWTGYIYHDVVQYTDLPEGGHFAALERGSSALFVADVRAFVHRVHTRASSRS